MALFGPDDVAFITGAGSGIGHATALQFVADGIRQIALVDLSGENLNATQAIIHATNAEVRSLGIKANVANPEDVENAIKKTIEMLGRIDYCVNSAGISGQLGPTESQEVENLDRVLSVNLRGIWLCEKAQIKQFLQQELRPLRTGVPHQTRGSIVNIASILGHIAMPGLGPYTISKHGILGLVKTDAIEYATQGIRVNAVCPGFTLTNMIAAEVERTLGPVIANTPVQRLGTPQEIAYATTFLSSDRSSYITGTSINIDGGYTAQ